MNDRLMIAAMYAPALARNCISGWSNEMIFECLSFADALLAAAGEKEDPATHEDCVSVAVHNAVMDRLQVDFDALKDKLAACERERDRSQSWAEGLQAELTEAIDARNAAEQSKERLAENLRKTRAAKFVCEQEAEAASLVIAALKRRLEPLTEDEVIGAAALWTTAMPTAMGLSRAFDAIRARRA